MALAERLDPLAEGLLGADREQDHPDARRAAPRPAARATASRVTTPLPLSLAPGHDPAHPDVGHRRGRAEPEEDPEPARAAGSRVSAPSAARTGPPSTGAISGGLVSSGSISPSRSASAGSGGMEDEARVGGVVVGDDHHRPLGVGRAELADDVVGGAPRQQLSQRPLAGREVGGDPGGAERPEQGPEQAPAAEGGDAAEGAEHGAEPERPPVGAVRAARPRSAPRRRARGTARRTHSAARRSPSEAEGRSICSSSSTSPRSQSGPVGTTFGARPYRGPTIHSCSAANR